MTRAFIYLETVGWSWVTAATHSVGYTGPCAPPPPPPAPHPPPPPRFMAKRLKSNLFDFLSQIRPHLSWRLPLTVST